MKLTLTIRNYNTILRSLRRAGVEIKKDFKSEIVDHGKELRDRAKEILTEESERRTNKRYWTGKLHDAIESRLVIREDNLIGVSIGVDLRSVKYAEWVEFGHYTGFGAGFGGGWWEGYHYLERAYTELAPKIPNQIIRTLRIYLKKYEVAGLQVSHRATGQQLGSFDIQ